VRVQGAIMTEGFLFITVYCLLPYRAHSNVRDFVIFTHISQFKIFVVYLGRQS
jgi:hypothetical protein